MASNSVSQTPMKADVVIIGYGPVGAMLANLLGLQGISTLVLERAAEIYDLPRAVHFDDEVMRLLQTVDLAQAMQSFVHVSPGMKFVDDAGRLLLDWPRSQDVGRQGWHSSYRFHQPDLERVLRQGVARWPSVTIQLRTEAFALEQECDAVTVRYEDLATGSLLRCQARYVVGCDGARSLVRRMMDAPMEDLGFHERWLVVDALLRRPRPDLGDWSVQYCSKQRPATYVRGTGDRRRWEIAVLPDEDECTITQRAKVLELLKPWVNSCGNRPRACRALHVPFCDCAALAERAPVDRGRCRPPHTAFPGPRSMCGDARCRQSRLEVGPGAARPQPRLIARHVSVRTGAACS